jgi:DNA-binding MarR family transcriptional regulator
MKLLDEDTIPGSVEGSAGTVMDTAFMVIRLVRAEIRRSRPSNLSLQQVQALGCVETCPGDSLSHLAEMLGLALPSASHLVDGLVQRGMLARRTDPGDRRQVRLDLTAKGERALQRAFDVTRADLTRRLAPLTSAQRAAVLDAMRVLRSVLGTAEAAPAK